MKLKSLALIILPILLNGTACLADADLAKEETMTRQIREHEGEKSSVYANRLSEMGWAYNGAGRSADAQKAFKEAYEIYLALPGHEISAAAMLDGWALIVEKTEPAKAEHLKLDALTVLDRLPPTNRERIAAHRTMADYYVAKGQMKEAAEQEAKLTELLGTNNVNILHPPHCAACGRG